MYVLQNQLNASPFRDFKLFPLREEKLKILDASIGKTGYWGGITCTPVDYAVDVNGKRYEGDDLVKYLNSLDIAFTINQDGKVLTPKQALKWLKENDPTEDFSEVGITFEPLFQLWQAYGHHRTESAGRMGYKFYDVGVRVLDDRTMLQMFAEENHAELKSDMLAQIETVRQVKQAILDDLEEADGDFEKYSKMVGATPAWDSKNAFAQATGQSLGYRPVHRTLGKTWKEADVRAINQAMEAIEGGLYEQEILVDFPNISTVGAFTTLAMNIKEFGKWPSPLQDEVVREVAAAIASPDVATSVAALRECNAFVKAAKEGDRVMGYDPRDYLTDGKKKALSVPSWLREFVDTAEDGWEDRLDALKEDERFKGTTDLSKFIKNVKDQVTSESEDEEEAGTDDDLQDDVDALTTDGEEATEPAEDLEPVGDLVSAFSQMTPSMCETINALKGRGAEITNEEEVSGQFEESLETLTTSIIEIVGETIGIKAYRDMITKINKAL